MIVTVKQLMLTQPEPKHAMLVMMVIILMAIHAKIVEYLIANLVFILMTVLQMELHV